MYTYIICNYKLRYTYILICDVGTMNKIKKNYQYKV